MNRRQKLVQQQYLNNEEAVIRRLNQVYSKSLSDITDKIESLEFTIGGLQQKYDWLDDDDPEKAKIKSQIQSKIYQKQYQEQLRSQVGGILEQMHTKSFTTVSDYLDECYSDGFIGAFFDQHGQGVPFLSPINQEAMVTAVQLDSKISKGLYTRLGEDVDLLKKKITAQVSRSIATGETFAQTARQLKNVSNIGYNNAIRIARTEGHRIQTTATMNAMESAKEQGADIVKQWDSTLDGATRSSHVAVDGEIRELNKNFSNGLRYPGDPSGRAAEVINCRCALLQRARWAVEDDDQSFTKYSRFTDQIEEFDSPQDYDEFKEAYMSKENKQYMDYVERMQDKYGTKDFATVLDRMSESEYKHYSGLLGGNPVYNKNGNLLTNGGNGATIVSENNGFRTIDGEHSINSDIGSRALPTCNPKFRTGGELFSNNCGYCSATFEMRRRGFDVIANPRDGLLVSDWEKLFVGSKPIPLTSKSTEALAKELQDKLSAFGDGARGSIFVNWKDNDEFGHFFSWEVENGVVRFVDGQNGMRDVRHYLDMVQPTSAICLRWDNLEPSDMIKEACKNRGGD